MYRLIFFAILMTLFSCGKEDKATITGTNRGFYYWQTSLDQFDWRDSTFRTFQANKIYFRFFDVDWSQEAQAPTPVAQLSWNYIYQWNPEAATVPVVFITNETFKNLNVAQSKELAHHVHNKLNGMLSSLLNQDAGYFLDDGYWQQNPFLMRSKDFREHPRYDSLISARMKSVKEVQFDCDWTESTRDKYFAFLEECNRLFEEKLVSSTIRLYQYKYPEKAGIPPVKRGMLMCYNAGDVRDPKGGNSIFELDEVMKYLEDGEYKLPLDYAVPIFEWVLLYQNGEIKQILPYSFLSDYRILLDGDYPNFKVNTDFTFGDRANSVLIRKGDNIRVESPDKGEVIKLAAYLGRNKNNSDASITLYHLSHDAIQKYSKEIEAIFDSF